jgi:hypothetical protein
MTESLNASYVHRDKIVEPKQELMLGFRRLKWYDIGAPDWPVPAQIHEMARMFLERRAAAGGLDQLGRLGFVVLHRCGAGFYFLLACSWLGNNEIWESVYAKDEGDPGFRDFPHPGPHRGTYCVWEMGAIWHETCAWRSYLLSARDEAALESWRADQYEGPI